MQWTPRTERDLQSAIDNGFLEESHTLDLKREFSPGKSGNRGLAKDIAAFSLDGGLILIGVDEGEDPTVPPTLSPQPLAGQSERIEQIALMAVTESAQVQTTTIASSADGYGYVAVRVPPSPRAPHMAEGKYYGRGEKTNIVLSHQEVLRLHERLLTARKNLIEEARESIRRIPLDVPLLAIIAEPLGAQEEMLVDLSAHKHWEAHVRHLLSAAGPGYQHSYAPTLTSGAISTARRAEGVAVTTGMIPNDRFQGRQQAAEVIFHESGRLSLLSERPVTQWNRNNDPDNARTVLLDELIVGNVDLMVRLVAGVAAYARYGGSWGFAIAATGLRDAVTREDAEHRFGTDLGQKYTADTYERATESTLLDITESPDRVVGGLTTPLLRALNLHRFPRWQRLTADDSD